MATLTTSVISTLTFLLLTTSSLASSPRTTTSFQSFIQCYLDNTVTSPDLLYTSNSTCYESILESSAQNWRFLASDTNRKPSAIVTPTSESQIAETVKCAYRYGLELRTRSGGHDYEGMSYVSDDIEHPFVVIDLQRLRSIDVDAEGRTAWVQAGATVGEVYYNVFNKTNGNAGFSAGICPTLGVGGHISVGGIGAIMRKFGVAADNVVDAKVVGIDGRVLDRSGMGEDLFWAIRGGGASFGVIVAYKLQLVDVPPIVTTFSIYRNLSQNATQLVTR